MFRAVTWVKGQSGNPGGGSKLMSKAYQDAREYGQQFVKECIDTYVHLMRTAQSEGVRKTATDALMDRIFGKPIQAIYGMAEMTKDGMQVKEMSADELRMIISGRTGDYLENLYQSGELKAFIDKKKGETVLIEQKKEQGSV